MIFRIFLLYVVILPASYAIDQLEVQGLFANKAVLMIDGQRHILAVGQVSPEGVKLISADSRSAILEVEGQQKEFSLGTTVTTQYAKAETVKEQIMANDYGMFLSYGNINGQSVRFLVDTGATSVAMSSIEARRLGILYRLDGVETRATTASGVVKAWGIKLKSVNLGKIKQQNVQAIVLQGSHPQNILLGMSFMDELKVNKEGNKLVLEQKN